LAGKPEEGWVWPAPTKSGHIEPSTLKKQHAKALRLAKVRPFVLYTLRHTMLTRLGESGCDVWTLARIAGHSNIRISERYVHPSTEHIERSVNGRELRKTGDKTGDILRGAQIAPRGEVPAIPSESVA
jgi:integrase